MNAHRDVTHGKPPPFYMLVSSATGIVIKTQNDETALTIDGPVGQDFYAHWKMLGSPQRRADFVCGLVRGFKAGRADAADKVARTFERGRHA